MTGFNARRELASEDRLHLKQLRRSGFAVAATLTSFIALASVPTSAQAQIFGMFGWSMPPGQVMHLIRSQGFRLSGPLYRNGRVYVADVMDDRGVRQRLIVDAFSGDVLQAFVLGRPSETFGNERSARFEPPDHGAGAPQPGPPDAGAPPPIAPQIGAPQIGAPQNIESLPPKPKAKMRTSVSKRETVRARPEPDARAPSADLPPSEATKMMQSTDPVVRSEPSKSEPANNEAAPAKNKAPEPVAAEPSPSAAKTPAVEAPPKQQAKAPAVNEMPAAPLDDAATVKKPNRSATDVPVAPLD